VSTSGDVQQGGAAPFKQRQVVVDVRGHSILGRL
jgi:hypothetical protein